MAVSFKVSGFDKLSKRFAELPKDLQEEVIEEIQATGKEINQQQKRLAPVDLGALQQRTNYVPLANGFEIVSMVKYAPYVEFGTGAFVRVPKGLETYAMQFKGNGKREVNIKAQPFFFPPYFQIMPKLRLRLKQVLKDVTK